MFQQVLTSVDCACATGTSATVMSNSAHLGFQPVLYWGRGIRASTHRSGGSFKAVLPEYRKWQTTLRTSRCVSGGGQRQWAALKGEAGKEKAKHLSPRLPRSLGRFGRICRPRSQTYFHRQLGTPGREGRSRPISTMGLKHFCSCK